MDKNWAVIVGSFGKNPLAPPPNFRHVGVIQLPNDYLRPHQTHLHIGFRPWHQTQTRSRTRTRARTPTRTRSRCESECELPANERRLFAVVCGWISGTGMSTGTGPEPLPVTRTHGRTDLYAGWIFNLCSAGRLAHFRRRCALDWICRQGPTGHYSR